MGYKKIYEGGNLTVNGKSATKLQVGNMDNEEFGDFKEDFIAFLLSVSDIYMEKTGYPIWNREDLLFKGKVFSGSTRAFFQKDRATFANKKPKVGDFDVQVPEDIFDTFHNSYRKFGCKSTAFFSYIQIFFDNFDKYTGQNDKKM